LALILYVIVAGAIVALWDRFVRPVSVAAMIVTIAMPLCFTGRAMFTGRVFAPVDIGFLATPLRDYASVPVRNALLGDVYTEMIPWRFAARDAITHGHWPLLNRFQHAGSPLAGAMQSAPFDPFRLIAMLLPFAASVTFGATITFFLAGFFTFAFARELGCSSEASLIGGAAFMFCGVMVFYVEWMQTPVFALLPLVMIGVRRSSFALLTIGLVLAVLAGHPESLFFVVLTGIAYGLTLGPDRRAIAIALASGIVALALTAIQLLPLFAILGETIEPRLRHEHPPVAADARQLAIHAGAMFLPFYGREQTALSDVQPGRMGAIAFVLAIAALGTIKRRETMFFAALAVIATLIGWDAPPFAQLMRWDLALNSRFIFVACFAIAILAAIGADAARRHALIAIVVAIALLIATWHTWPDQLAAGVRAPMIKTMLIADLLPLCVFLWPRRPIAAILGLLLLQRTIQDANVYPTLDTSLFYPRVPILTSIPTTDDPFRIVGVGNALPPNSATVYGLEDVRGYEALTNTLLVETFPQWCTQPIRLSFNRVDDLSRPFLSLMNVRYAIATREVSPPDGWRKVAEDRNTILLENTRAKPRAFIERGEGTVTTRRAPNGLTIDANITRDSSLTISQVAWNGWRATIDGKDAKLGRAHHALLAIDVPRGHHTIDLVYMPRAFIIGRAITFAAIALLLAFVVIRRRM